MTNAAEPGDKMIGLQTDKPPDLIVENSTVENTIVDSLTENNADTNVRTREIGTDSVSSPLGNPKFANIFNIAISPKKPEVLLIEDNVCLKCNRGCEGEILSCYICNLAAHYCCYPSQCTDDLKTLARGNFEKAISFKQHKWFCQDCSKLTFNNVTEIISNGFTDQLKNMLSMFQTKLIEEVKGVVSIEIKNAVDNKYNCNDNRTDCNDNHTNGNSTQIQYAGIVKNSQCIQNNNNQGLPIRNNKQFPNIDKPGTHSHSPAPAEHRETSSNQESEYGLTNGEYTANKGNNKLNSKQKCQITIQIINRKLRRTIGMGPGAHPWIQAKYLQQIITAIWSKVHQQTVDRSISTFGKEMHYIQDQQATQMLSQAEK